MSKLDELITGKGFDRYQSGLRSRFAAHGLKYNYEYDLLKKNLILHFESERDIGLCILSEDGRFNFTVTSKDKNQIIFNKVCDIKSEDDFHKIYPEGVSFMLRLEKRL